LRKTPGGTATELSLPLEKLACHQFFPGNLAESRLLDAKFSEFLAVNRYTDAFAFPIWHSTMLFGGSNWLRCRCSNSQTPVVNRSAGDLVLQMAQSAGLPTRVVLAGSAVNSSDQALDLNSGRLSND
jgi:hypothetical protein